LALARPGILRLREPINVQGVLDAHEFWHPPREPQSAWLHDEVLPSVRTFLVEHGGHRLVFWEIEDLPEDCALNWLPVGHHPYPTARYVAEVVKIRDWDGAVAWLAGQGLHPWAANDAAGRERYREAFERFVNGRAR
jgi:hypothetical protein